MEVLGGAVTQSVEAQHPFLTSPVHSFHLAAPEFCSFMANWSSSAIGKKEKEKRTGKAKRLENPQIVLHLGISVLDLERAYAIS